MFDLPKICGEVPQTGSSLQPPNSRSGLPGRFALLVL